MKPHAAPTAKKPRSFANLKNGFEVIDAVRGRYQMFVRSAAELQALVFGYAMAAGSDFDVGVDDFRSFVSKRLGDNDPRLSWTDRIAAHAIETEYEVSLFLMLLDEFRGTKHVAVAEAALSHEQRRFDFDRRNAVENIDFPQPVLRPPHRLRAIEVDGVGLRVFFFDASDNKYYEQGPESLERIFKWAKDCYNLERSDWTVHSERVAARETRRSRAETAAPPSKSRGKRRRTR